MSSKFDEGTTAHKSIATVGVCGIFLNRTHIVIRSREFPKLMIIAVSMGAWLIIQLTRIWEFVAPCVFIFLLVQLIIAILSSLIFYRTYHILYQLATQQKAQVIMQSLGKKSMNKKLSSMDMYFSGVDKNIGSRAASRAISPAPKSTPTGNYSPTSQSSMMNPIEI